MNIGKKAHFEQDRHYTDLDGNLKTFTIRDYSKKQNVAMNGQAPTEESKSEAAKAYDEAVRVCINEFVKRNPAQFAQDTLAVEKAGNAWEWNEEALFLMYKQPNRAYAGSDWSKVQQVLIIAILNYLGHTDIPEHWDTYVEQFRDVYETTGEL